MMNMSTWHFLQVNGLATARPSHDHLLGIMLGTLVGNQLGPTHSFAYGSNLTVQDAGIPQFSSDMSLAQFWIAA